MAFTDWIPHHLSTVEEAKSHAVFRVLQRGGAGHLSVCPLDSLKLLPMHLTVALKPSLASLDQGAPEWGLGSPVVWCSLHDEGCHTPVCRGEQSLPSSATGRKQIHADIRDAEAPDLGQYDWFNPLREGWQGFHSRLSGSRIPHTPSGAGTSNFVGTCIFTASRVVCRHPKGTSECNIGDA